MDQSTRRLAREGTEPPAARPRPPEGESLEGWTPVLGPDLTLAEVIDLAFDYRGNVTVVMTDGIELVGYVFNRDPAGAEPCIQMYDEAGDGPITIPYRRIANIAFTGKDPAAGRSWKAWLEQKERERAAARGSLPRDGAHPRSDRH